MKRLPAFFLIGSAGMVVNAVLHVAMTLGLGMSGSHSAFLGIYPVFIAFLAIGTAQLLRQVAIQGR